MFLNEPTARKRAAVVLFSTLVAMAVQPVPASPGPVVNGPAALSGDDDLWDQLDPHLGGLRALFAIYSVKPAARQIDPAGVQAFIDDYYAFGLRPDLTPAERRAGRDHAAAATQVLNQHPGVLDPLVETKLRNVLASIIAQLPPTGL